LTWGIHTFDESESVLPSSDSSEDDSEIENVTVKIRHDRRAYTSSRR
jgi:hypothetical protein